MDTQRGFWSALWPIAGLALLYYLFARLGLPAAASIGTYASPVWPAAGIAWSAVLVLGPRVAPGIWLGSLAVNLQLLLSANTSNAASAFTASIIAAGSTLQALAATFAIRRTLGSSDAVPRSPQQVVLFVCIAAACCMLAATFGVWGLCLSGANSWQTYWQLWRPWWLGDFTGVLLITPLLWTWASPPRRTLLDSALFPLAGLGIGVSCLACFGIWEMNDRTIAETFARHSADIAASVRRSVEERVRNLESIAAFSAASEVVERSEFRNFVAPLIAPTRSMIAFAWVPRVPMNQRAAFITEARRDGFANFEFTELNSEGNHVPAPNRAEYFPVYFIEPYAGNEDALGCDLASDPVRRGVIEQIRESGRPVATPALFPLLEEGSHRKGAALYWPIYVRGAPLATAEQRREHFSGFYSVTFSISTLMEEALKYLAPKGIDVYLVDESAARKAELLYFHASRLAPESPRINPADLRVSTHFASVLEVGSRKWTVICKPGPDYFSSQRSAMPWVVLVFTLIFTALLGAFICSEQGTKAAMRRLNAELVTQVERRKAELAVVETANYAIVTADCNGRIIGWNKGAQTIFGYKNNEVIGQSLTLLIPERYRAAHTAGISRYLATGEVHIIGQTVELHGLHKDGREFPVDLSLSTWSLAGETFFSAIMRDVTERKQAREHVEAALRKEAALRQEVHHRVKNNLQVISSLLYLQSANSTDPKVLEALREGQSRAHSIALIHEKLYGSSNMSKIEVAGYLRQLAADLLQAYEVSRGSIHLEVESSGVYFGLDEAIPCGLIVNELISNSLKHGFPSGRKGVIAVVLRPAGNGFLELSVRDDGIGLPEGFDLEKATTFGLKLVRDLTRQLDGTITFHSDGGTVAKVTFPTPESADDL